MQGIRVTTLGRRRYSDAITRAMTPLVENTFGSGAEQSIGGVRRILTFRGVEDGYVSVTPLHLDLTNYKLLEEIRAWELAL
ncbi:MAG: hypothetical protein CM1200mP14_22680 [Gammaproteobacteria bacterium]|nr:MAG: hypothetical protein CM1200mP14_22680 [Gammaproteobacteria bacterium]